jgi:ribosomal protein L16/L10AE
MMWINFTLESAIRSGSGMGSNSSTTIQQQQQKKLLNAQIHDAEYRNSRTSLRCAP